MIEQLYKGKALKKYEIKSSILIFVIFIIAVILAGHSCSYGKKLEMLKCHSDIKPTMRQIQMAEYFRRAGNKNPELMAEAVLATNKPKLMAAIAIKENTPYTCRKGGYKKRHVGAWQVNEKLHGYAGINPVQQALKAEAVLDDLLVECNGNLRKALNIYGGDKTRKVYAENILEELKNIP